MPQLDSWESLDIQFRDLDPSGRDLRLDCVCTLGNATVQFIGGDGMLVVDAGGEGLWKIIQSSNEILLPRWEKLAARAGAKVGSHFGRRDDGLQLWLNLLSPRFDYGYAPPSASLNGWIENACVASAVLCIQLKILLGLSAPRKRGRPSGKRVDGDKIRKYRGEYSQEDFASKCGLAVSTLQRAEHGSKADEPTRIKIATCVRDVRGIPCSPDDLLLK